MVFSSITFMFFFLPAVILLYYIVPSLKARNALLLLASLLFYTWGEPHYVVIMLFSIAINYLFGRLIGYSVDCQDAPPPSSVYQQDKHNVIQNGSYKQTARAKVVLAIAIISNLSLLCAFKYAGLLTKVVNKTLHWALHVPNIALPIGISFYTFQAMSYIIDVYRNPSLRQKNLFHLGLYIAFFPQLVAGPIVRYNDIQAQIEKRTHSIKNVACGLKRLIIGLSKKVLIANILAQSVDYIYSLSPSDYNIKYAWFAALSYSLQIYFDFAGYSDMAIGLGKIFGFCFRENFLNPYSALGIRDFWRRWHISLSSWFRDYVYIPLGGNRISNVWTTVNKYIVFFLTGLWHGASVNFVLWGLGHGTLMMIEDTARRRWGRLEAKLPSASRKATRKAVKLLWRAATLLAIVLLWVLFRNVRWKRGIKAILKMFGLCAYHPATNRYIRRLYAADNRNLAAFIAGVALCLPWSGILRRLLSSRLCQWLKAKSALRLCASCIKGALLIALLIASSAYLIYGAYNPFIYFRF